MKHNTGLVALVWAFIWKRKHEPKSLVIRTSSQTAMTFRPIDRKTTGVTFGEETHLFRPNDGKILPGSIEDNQIP